MDDWGYGSWGMDRIAQWGMDRGMDRGVWIACGPGPLIHTLYFDLHPYGCDTHVLQRIEGWDD